jgi:putative hydrolase of the HAD superfamily
MTRRINGILFDLGDTILDFGKVDVLSMFEAGARLSYDYLLSLEMPLPSFARYFRRQLRAIRWNYLKSRLTRREFNSLDVLGRLHRRMGHRLSPAQRVEIAWRWYQPLSEQATVEEGVDRMLRQFHDDGLTIAVVSNTFVPGEVLDRHLEQLSLLELLPIRIYSCDVRYRKPHPGIFRIASDRSGLAPQEALFVGDSPRADILGASRAGMATVLKDPTGRHAEDAVAADHCIKSLAELPAILAGYNSPAESSQQRPEESL